MSYKLLATDMDGTLLNENIEISKRTIEALEKAKEKGIEIVFATGRLHKSAEQYAKGLSFKVPIISSNGAMMTDDKFNVIYENNLSKDTIRLATRIMDDMDIYYHMYTKDSVYSQNIDEDFLKRYYDDGEGNLSVNTVEFSSIDKLLKEDINFTKILASDKDYDKLDKLENRLYEEMKDVEITKSGIDNVEVMNKNVSKAVALEELCNRLDIKSEEVISVGDNENDIPMLEFAGKGIAMGNAVELTKEKADELTDTNVNDGLAKVIEKYLI